MSIVTGTVMSAQIEKRSDECVRARTTATSGTQGEGNVAMGIFGALH